MTTDVPRRSPRRDPANQLLKWVLALAGLMLLGLAAAFAFGGDDGDDPQPPVVTTEPAVTVTTAAVASTTTTAVLSGAVKTTDTHLVPRSGPASPARTTHLTTP